MTRYCIIAGPRSGSTWLEFMIYYYLKKHNQNAVRLGEFFHPDVAKNEKFEQLENNIFTSKFEHYDDNFFEHRLKLLQTSSLLQPATLRLFLQTYSFSVNYSNIINVINECNFQFISLYRDLFERVLSWCLMDQTHYIHNFKNHYTTLSGKKESMIYEQVIIDKDNFKRRLLHCIEDDNNRKNFLQNMNSISINYDTLITDCKRNNILIIENTHVKKLRNVPNNSIVLNYDELLKIYETYTN